MATDAATAVPGGKAHRRPVPLSAILKQIPQNFERQKVSAVERFVTFIDLLPDRYHEAQAVYLSKNSLSSIDGIQQFRAIRSLSLADNLLASWEDLAPLVKCIPQRLPLAGGEAEAVEGGCPLLESLSLEGNPLCRLPNYRAHVVQMLPRLRMLDGRQVTDEERAAAVRAVDREDACMKVLVSNACSVHKMVGGA